MKRLVLRMMLMGAACGLLLVPVAGHADSDRATAPPIGQQVVREGDFAVRMAAVLGMGTAENEAEAESRLAEGGISPKNGWIADYPMTPDICGEIYKAVRDAAAGGRIGLSVESALERLNGAMAEAGLSATAASEGAGSNGYAGTASAPGEATINDYYDNEGPPIVTYYSPPYDYLYLYAWVPYPFWCYGFWFPGYYILNDFHRVAYAGRRGVFVSNHYRDMGGQRYTRIDPVARFSGRPAATSGGPVRSGLPPAGVSRGGRGTGGNGSTPHLAPNSRFSAPASRGGGTYGTPSYRGRGAFNAPAAAPRTAITQQRSIYRGNAPSIAPSRSSRGNSVAAYSGRGNSFSSTPMPQSRFPGESFRRDGAMGTTFRSGGFSARGRR